MDVCQFNARTPFGEQILKVCKYAVRNYYSTGTLCVIDARVRKSRDIMVGDQIIGVKAVKMIADCPTPGARCKVRDNPEFHTKDYVELTQDVLRAKISADLVDPNELDPLPFVKCFREQGLTELNLRAAIKSGNDMEPPRLVSCLNKLIAH
jgi:hypothetical protein